MPFSQPNHPDESWTSVRASCGCKTIYITLELPSSALPLTQWLCHCTVCRSCTGQLAHGTVALPLEARNMIISGTPSYYDTARYRRFFCGQCGSHVYATVHETGTVRALMAGAVEGEGIFRFVKHVWVQETGDGGMSSWLPAPGDGLEEGKGDQVGVTEERVIERKLEGVDMNAEVLEGGCHCGGVRFEITRPGEHSKNLKKVPLPEILVRKYGEEQKGNVDEIKWWLSKDGRRYIARICLCASCTRFSGFEYQPWVTIPEAGLRFISSSSISESSSITAPIQTQLDSNLSPDLNIEISTQGPTNALTSYSSSLNINRYFCTTCGAKVAHTDSRNMPGLVDVSVGLLRSPAGVRAEDWLAWVCGDTKQWTEQQTDAEDKLVRKEMVSRRFQGIRDTRNRGMLAKLGTGMRAWAERTGQETLP